VLAPNEEKSDVPKDSFIRNYSRTSIVFIITI
jgi:hypothetical protein